MKEILTQLAPWINGTLFLTFIVLLFNRKKINAETQKISNESHEISNNIEMKLIEFYQNQITSLTQKYEELRDKLEKKERDHINCEERICELEEKYYLLMNEIKQLKK